MNPLGIMQGRLTDKGGFFPQQFPWSDWETEFEISGRAGLQCIEWMFNYENFSENPLITDSGQKKLKDITIKTGVNVLSVCANYIMEDGIFRSSDALEAVNDLISSMGKIGIRLLILPLFGESEPKNKEEYSQLKKVLEKVLSYAERCKVRVGIETDWELSKTHDFLLISSALGICYDLGNAAGLGKNLIWEIENLRDRIIDVHIKDKPVGGKTVMLGEGSVDYCSCFEALNAVSYAGPYIFESYYGQYAIQDTLRNVDYIRAKYKG